MESNLVSLKRVKYQKQYREFYSKPENRAMSVSVFLKGDTVKKVKIS